MESMAQSCGSEDYAWTAEATTVTLLREIVGFREYFDLGLQPSFIMRPTLPWTLLRAANTATQRFSVRDLRFRGIRFHVHLRPLGAHMVELELEHATSQMMKTNVVLKNGDDAVKVTPLLDSFRIEWM